MVKGLKIWRYPLRCTECGFRIQKKQVKELPHCLMCGTKLIGEVRDFLEDEETKIVTELRPTQLAMALAIEEALDSTDSTLVLAEGHTGVGKSFAYLIPAMLNEKTGRLIVATAKKTLQDQLYEKDIPYLLKELGVDKTVANRKGKNNYICMHSAASLKNPSDKEAAINVFTKKEGRLRLLQEEEPHWWSKAAVNKCRGVDCEHFHQCGYAQDAASALSADIVVTNHHIFAYDVIHSGALLGIYSTLIVDEAHQLEHSLRSAWTISLSSSMCSRLAEHLNSYPELLKDLNVLTPLWNELFDKFDGLESDTTITVCPVKDIQPLKKAVIALLQKVDSKIKATPPDSGAWSDLTKAQTLLGDAHEGLLFAFSPAYVAYIKVHTASTTLMVSPIDISLPDATGNLPPTAVLTSATLTVNGSFSYLKKSLGLYNTTHWNNTVEEIYTSPFDMRKQALLYTPRHIPIPAKEDEEYVKYLDGIVDECAQLIEASKGGTFVLFTAIADMEYVAEALPRHRLIRRNPEIEIFAQTYEASKVADDFMQASNGVILGVKSFWEGIDVPGLKLRQVIITKLPFPNINDPIFKAKMDRVKNNGNDSFMELTIPNMVMDLKQAAGRLIRTKTDKGVVAVLDARCYSGTSRVATHDARMRGFKVRPDSPRFSYGGTAISSLAFPQVTSNTEFVKKFLVMLAKKFLNE